MAAALGCREEPKRPGARDGGARAARGARRGGGERGQRRAPGPGRAGPRGRRPPQSRHARSRPLAQALTHIPSIPEESRGAAAGTWAPPRGAAESRVRARSAAPPGSLRPKAPDPSPPILPQKPLQKLPDTPGEQGQHLPFNLSCRTGLGVPTSWHHPSQSSGFLRRMDSTKQLLFCYFLVPQGKARQKGETETN